MRRNIYSSSNNIIVFTVCDGGEKGLVKDARGTKIQMPTVLRLFGLRVKVYINGRDRYSLPDLSCLKESDKKKARKVPKHLLVPCEDILMENVENFCRD